VACTLINYRPVGLEPFDSRRARPPPHGHGHACAYIRPKQLSTFKTPLRAHLHNKTLLIHHSVVILNGRFRSAWHFSMRRSCRRSPPQSLDLCLSGAGTIDAACMDRQRRGAGGRAGTGPFGPRHGASGRAHARTRDMTPKAMDIASQSQHPVRVNPQTPASAARWLWSGDNPRVISPHHSFDRLAARRGARGARKRTGASRLPRALRQAARSGAPPPPTRVLLRSALA